MGKSKDLTGERIGDFLILCEGGGRAYGNSDYVTKTWLATCDCGLTFDKRGIDYRNAKGCPCKVKANAAERCRGRFSKNVDESMQQRRVLTPSGLDSPCWELNYKKHHTGYQYVFTDGRQELAHVYSYRKHHGPVPDGMEVSHLCHNKACHNPEHLTAESHTDNMRRSVEDGRLSCNRAFSEEVALKAIKMIEDGERNIDIAKQLGIAYHSVVDIRRGASCRNLRSSKASK